ncbi:hypothetical protein [Streptomyces sp. NPDC127190]|uniref:hypothetical protein n=1 Tax=unclassified Streptomyces TaxID=2593676 RepID=UPI003632FB01
MLLLTYGTVITQVAFPFTVLNRRVKNVLVGVLVAEHLGIATLLAIPFLPLAMVVCDLVFLPTAFLNALGMRCAALVRRPVPGAPSSAAG